MSGNDKFVDDWSVGRAQRTLDSLSLWRVHTLQKDLAQLGDGMFSSGKSWSPSFEALGLRSSVRLAEGASRRGSICIVRSSSCLATDLEVMSFCQAVWQWLLLHSVVELLGGRVHLLTNCVGKLLSGTSEAT